jgi:hypothetical protein
VGEVPEGTTTSGGTDGATTILLVRARSETRTLTSTT